MKKISLLLIIALCTLLGSGIISRQSSNIAVFNTIKRDANINEYTIEELVEQFFADRKVSITKVSETEFYINDSIYYLSYINGDISYTHKQFNKSDRAVFTNILFQNSLETINSVYDTKEIEGITRMQALDNVKLVVNKLGLDIAEEPYVFLSNNSNYNSSNINSNGIIEAFKVKTSWGQKEDCYYILWKDRLNTTAYKTLNDNSSKYRNYSETNIGNTILAIVTKDGVIDLEISKVYGSLQGVVQY